jgi:hypothetical protein
MALLSLKIPFRYQVPELGGYGDRMSTIIDFVIQRPNALQPTALYVDGPRWHSARGGKQVEDLLKRRRLEQYGYVVKVIADQSETAEGARAWCKENLA